MDKKLAAAETFVELFKDPNIMSYPIKSWRLLHIP